MAVLIYGVPIHLNAQEIITILQKRKLKCDPVISNDNNSTESSNRCDICGKVFTKSKVLARHRLMHTGQAPFNCMFCDKSFYCRSNLTAHLRIHTGQKPYECAVCQKSFTQNGQLKEHMRIHSGELPYQCGTCSRSFRNSSALVTHLRIHTGEKPYKCDTCLRAFTTSTSLKTHRVTHSGEMLYECPLCQRQFNRRNNLNVHIKRHNKDRSFTCPLCHNGFVMRAHLLVHLKRSHKVDCKAIDGIDMKSIFSNTQKGSSFDFSSSQFLKYTKSMEENATEESPLTKLKNNRESKYERRQATCDTADTGSDKIKLETDDHFSENKTISQDMNIVVDNLKATEKACKLRIRQDMEESLNCFEVKQECTGFLTATCDNIENIDRNAEKENSTNLHESIKQEPLEVEMEHDLIHAYPEAVKVEPQEAV